MAAKEIVFSSAARAEIAEAELAKAKARAELREITRRTELEATP